MRRTHRLTQRFNQSISVCVCLSLFVALQPLTATGATSPTKIAQAQRPLISQGQRQPAQRTKEKEKK